MSNDNKKQNGKTARSIGILTAGGDCPGLNAAIRAVAKSAMHYGIQVVGFLDGFRGLVENRYIPLEDRTVSGIITLGGTNLLVGAVGNDADRGAADEAATSRIRWIWGAPSWI